MHVFNESNVFILFHFLWGCYGGALVFLGGAGAPASPSLAPPMVLWCAIIFRETHGERSSRHRITWPYHFAKWFALFQRSLQPKTAKEPKPTTTLAKQINIVNKRIKISMFLPQNYVLLCTESTYSISPALSLTDSLHTLTYALMLLALLWLYQ